MTISDSARIRMKVLETHIPSTITSMDYTYLPFPLIIQFISENCINNC